MELFPKINGPFYRDHVTNKLIMGEWCRDEFDYLQDNAWTFTEKVDGTNIRMRLMRAEDFMTVEYGGRTYNAQIPIPLLEVLEGMFPTFPGYRRDLNKPAYRDRYMAVGLWMVDSNIDDVILYGEGYGGKIQSGGKYRSDPSFILFDVKIGNFWLKRDDVVDIAFKLGIDVVPLVAMCSLNDVFTLVEDGLKSEFGDFYAEGVVGKPKVNLLDRSGKPIIVKVKHRDFYG